MRFLSILFLSIICSLALTGCGKSAPSDTISEAEAALNAGDFKRARIVEHLIADTASNALLPSELCRIALIYMHLAETNKLRYDDDVAVAAECYMRALRINNDSVVAFRENVAVSELPALNTLNELVCAIISPVDISDSIHDAYPDSIPEGLPDDITDNEND